jgi:hypothetical protein
MNSELRQAAIVCLRIAGEQRMARAPDTGPRLSGDYAVSPERRAELESGIARSRMAASQAVGSSGGVYAPVRAVGRRQRDDPPEGFFFLMQVEMALDLLDEPPPGQPARGEFNALFEHRYVKCLSPFSYRGSAELRVLVETVGSQIGQMAEEDMTIVQQAIREWKIERRRDRKESERIRMREHRARRKALVPEELGTEVQRVADELREVLDF